MLQCAAVIADGHALPSERQNETAPFKLESTVPSRLALGARCGYGQRCWGSPVRQKKKHTGNHRLEPVAGPVPCLKCCVQTWRFSVSRVGAQVGGPDQPLSSPSGGLAWLLDSA